MDYISVLFSPLEAGNGTLVFAAGLAQAFEAELRIQGYYFVPVTLGDIPLAVVPVEESRGIAERQLEVAALEVRNAFPELRISTTLDYGDAQEAIDPDKTTDAPLLTIIPNSERGEEPALSGIRSDELIRELAQPVLCVTAASAPQLPGKILVAVGSSEDIPSLEYPVFSRLQAMGELSISWCRIAVGDDPAEARHSDEVRVIQADDIEGGIRNEVEASGADWLVIAPRSHNFFAELFHRNHTAHLLRDLSIPILAIR